MRAVLAPNSIAPVLLVILRGMEGIVETCYNQHQPRKDGADFVSPNCLEGVSISASERVYYCQIVS
jgi:hypothetical protein